MRSRYAASSGNANCGPTYFITSGSPSRTNSDPASASVNWRRVKRSVSRTRAAMIVTSARPLASGWRPGHASRRDPDTRRNWRFFVVRTLSCLAAGALTAALIAAPIGKTEPIKFISLKGHTNVKWDQNLHSDRFENNNLKSLPTGKQKFGDVEFEIGDGLMQLGSSNVESKPKEIKDIKVGRALKKLDFLQACGYSTENDTVIGKYVVHYADKTTADIEIVFGRDVVDW